MRRRFAVALVLAIGLALVLAKDAGAFVVGCYDIFDWWNSCWPF